MYNIISVGWSSMEIVIMIGIYKHFYFEFFNRNTTNHGELKKIRCIIPLCGITRTYTRMRRITTFRSTTDRIYDGGPIILYYYSIIWDG